MRIDEKPNFSMKCSARVWILEICYSLYTIDDESALSRFIFRAYSI